MQRLQNAGILAASVLLCLGPASVVYARGRHAQKSSAHHGKTVAHKGAAVGKSRKSHHHHSSRPKRHARIYQDISGRVAFDRFDTPPVYGPFLPPVYYDYPRLPCEPIDAPLEARLHDPQVDTETPEGQAAMAAESAEDEAPAAAGTRARVARGLARVAEKIGSLFRPKSAEAVVKPQDVDLTELLAQDFAIPVEGVDAQKLKDSFLSSRGRHHKHLAIDIGAPRGTPILATTDGEITRIVRERRSGKAIYQKDSTGQYLLFYCHLSRYAEDLKVGEKVKKGDVIGYVGATGHVIGGPHLHFSITRLPDEGSFRRGLAINPYLLFLAEVP